MQIAEINNNDHISLLVSILSYPAIKRSNMQAKWHIKKHNDRKHLESSNVLQFTMACYNIKNKIK